MISIQMKYKQSPASSQYYTDCHIKKQNSNNLKTSKSITIREHLEKKSTANIQQNSNDIWSQLQFLVFFFLT